MKARQPTYRFLAIAGFGLALAGCGGDSGTQRFVESEVTDDSELKAVNLDWKLIGPVDHFVIERNPDGSSGFARADINGDGRIDEQDRLDGGRPPARAADVKVPLHFNDPDKALYQVVARNPQGDEIARSRQLPLSEIPERELIGYIKASDTTDGDEFGFEVKLSQDGSTLAVSAKAEDGENTQSDLTGREGNECVRRLPSEDVSSGTEKGSVHIFTRASDGSWSHQANIQGSNTGVRDCFGSAIDLSADGDRLVVGAESESSDTTGVILGEPTGSQDNDNARDAGAVYVFGRDGGSWSQTAYIKPSALRGGIFFGSDVALSEDGSTIAVGAQEDSNDATGVDPANSGSDETGATESGAVYVFERDAGGWSQQSYIKASNTTAFDTFGGALDLSETGNTLAVGALNEAQDSTGVGADPQPHAVENPQDVGAVFVFGRDGGGNWSQREYIKPSFVGFQSSDDKWEFSEFFGTDVALSNDGDTLVVGASGDDSDFVGVNNGGGSNDVAKNDNVQSSGAAYVYTRANGNWNRDAYIKASNTTNLNFFGERVAISPDGRTIAVGAPGEFSATSGVNNGGQDNTDALASGAVYVFENDGGTWSQRAYVKAPNPDQFDGFGISAALSRNASVLAVGSRFEASNAKLIDGNLTNNDRTDAGAAYLY